MSHQYPGKDIITAVIATTCMRVLILPGQLAAIISFFLSKKARCQSFQDGTNSVKVFSFRGAQFAHDRPLIGDDLDEPLSLQLPQGLANHGARHACHLNEFAFDQPLPGRKAARNDGAAQRFKHLLAQRRCMLFNPDDLGALWRAHFWIVLR